MFPVSRLPTTLMTKHITQRIYGTERLALWGFLAGSAACVALYLYFLSSSVASIVLRQETAMQIRSIGAEVSSLESQYLAKKQEISPETAVALGFIPVADEEKIFIARTGTSGLSLATPQR